MRVRKYRLIASFTSIYKWNPFLFLHSEKPLEVESRVTLGVEEHCRYVAFKLGSMTRALDIIN